MSKAGSDSGPGSQAHPYLTIGKAAAVAQAGDTVIVHGGTYREWVKPVRGGASESDRIVYRAAPGEIVSIKGSEPITSWTRRKQDVWEVELPNSFFGDYNPYALKLSGGWLNYGQWHHRGDVYLKGEALYEKETAAEVEEVEHSWHCRVDREVTIIRANFGDVNPNTETVEINVRECLFMPEVSGLKYITVDGFRFMHAAANWSPPGLELQTGAAGPRMGKHWIIENCEITNARCVGIILGHAPGVDYDDIDAYGDHIVRNNVIRRCGQAGIAGQKGATRSVISGNLVEDTNYPYDYHPDVKRRSQYFQPHTTKTTGGKTGTAQDDKWFNNIFVREGLDRVKAAQGYASDYNVFLEGAKKSTFGDDNSIADPHVTGLAVQDHPRGATITFSISDAPLRAGGPQVSAGLVGVFPTVGQTIEDRDGNPISIDSDINGNRFTRSIPGPLANLAQGKNAITWSMGKQ